MNAREMINKLPTRGWAVLGGAVFGSILLLYIILHFATQTSYSTLLTGLNPAQTGKITSTLSTQGIPYEIQGNGTAIAVPAADSAQARVALASANLLTANQPDFSLFDKSQLGASDFQQQVTYQRALEGQLAETIDNIQGVTGAQVQLVLPTAQSQLYADNTTPTTAAVLLSGGGNLDSAQIHGIAQLVSSSVQGLQLSNVTITDDTGALLWPDGSASGSGSGGSVLSKQAAQQQYDRQQAAMIDAMLASTLGPGKAMVQVSANLDANQQTLQALTYTGKGVPLTQHTETETLKGTGGGSATTATAVPQYTPSGTTGSSNYNHQITTTNYGVNKTVTQTTVAPGSVLGVNAAMYIDSSIPAAEVASVKSAVSSALGMVPSRGDTLSVAQLKFAPATTTKVATPAVNPVSYAKYAALGLGALLFLFFTTRMLRRRERESLAGEPTWLRELEHRRTLSEFERDAEPPPPIKQLRPHVNTAKRQVEDLVDRDPDRVAMQVRAWMAED